jgi:hypothetical protein
MAAMGERFVVHAVRADRFTDPENARLLYLAAGGLAVAGLVLLAVTVWWWRSSRVESPVLAPLEVMGWRRWTRSTWSERKRLVDEVRPDDSLALSDAPIPPEEIDLRTLVAATPESFDDLREGYEAPVAVGSLAAVAPESQLDAVFAEDVVAGVGCADEVFADDGAVVDVGADAGLDADHSEQLDLGLASMVHRLEFIADGHIDADDEPEGSEAESGDDVDVGEQLAMTLDPLLRGTT